MSTINLLPDDYLLRKSQRRANILCVVMFAVVMATVGAAAIVSERNTANTEKVRDQVNIAYADAAKTLQEMQQLETQKRTMVHKAEVTGALLEKVPRSYLLAIVTQALPENVSLTSFNLTPQRVTSTPGKTKFDSITGKSEDQEMVMTVEVTGMAATDVDVARFIANLLRCQLLSGVDLAFSQEKKLKDTSVREFQVRMDIRNGVDVVDLLRTQPEQPAQSAATILDKPQGARL